MTQMIERKQRKDRETEKRSEKSRREVDEKESKRAVGLQDILELKNKNHTSAIS